MGEDLIHLDNIHLNTQGKKGQIILGQNIANSGHSDTLSEKELS